MENKNKYIKCLSDVDEVDLLSMEHFNTGIPSLDRCLSGVYFGQLIVLTGKRGEGKSTFASWILANALDKGWKVFAYSGELPDYHFRNWLDLQIAGIEEQNVTKNEYGDEIYSVRSEARERLTEFYKGRAYVYDNSIIPDGSSEESLTSTIETAAIEYGCRVILVDNLMTAIEVEPSADQYRAQSNFVKKLKFLAQKYKLAVILIAHPRKEGENNALTAESVAGSGDITNLADTVLTYEKCPEKLSENDRFQSRIGVRKNRLTGKRLLNDETMVKVIYSVQTKRIVENESDGLKRICCFAESRKYVDNEPPF